MTEHDIKVQPQFWYDVLAGRITAQLRRNDREYRVDDILLLREHNPSFGYTGESCRRRVTHILHNEDLPNGCPPGWVVLSMQMIEDGTSCDHNWIEIRKSSYDIPVPYMRCPRCGSTAPAFGNAELDAGVPNHDDPSKRGFDPA